MADDTLLDDLKLALKEYNVYYVDENTNNNPSLIIYGKKDKAILEMH